jgi:hypothetical protein
MTLQVKTGVETGFKTVFFSAVFDGHFGFKPNKYGRKQLRFK